MNRFNTFSVLIIILTLAFLIRLLVSPFYTHVSDMGLWKFWAKEIETLGFNGFFQAVSWTDYLPFYFYILFGLQKISLLFGATDLVFKMPAILADLATGFLIFKLSASQILKTRFILMSLYLFNPAVFANSAMWGQVDGLGAFLMVLALFLFLKKRLFLLGVVLAAACLFKPIYLFAMPVFIAYQIKINLAQTIKLILSFIISVFIITFPFTMNLWQVPSLIINRYLTALEQYPYASVNAFNFWGLVGLNWQPDNLTYLYFSWHVWGLIIFGLIYLTILIKILLVNSKNSSPSFSNLNLSLLLIFFGLFTFATRAHERHLLTSLPFLGLLFFERDFISNGLYLIVSLVYLLNLYFGIEFLRQGGRFAFGNDLVQALSGIIVISMAILFFKFLKTFKYD